MSTAIRDPRRQHRKAHIEGVPRLNGSRTTVCALPIEVTRKLTERVPLSQLASEDTCQVCRSRT